jgi:hypothetical protein
VRPDPKAFALAGYPDLNFTPRAVYAGPDGVVIRDFSSPAGAEAVKVARFDDDGLVRESAAYYE